MASRFYFARSVPVLAGAGLLCLWGQLPAQASSGSVNHIGEATDMILASSPAGPLFRSKMTFEKLAERFWFSAFWYSKRESLGGSQAWAYGWSWAQAAGDVNLAGKAACQL